MKYLLCLLFASFCFISKSSAAVNPYPKYEESIWGTQIINCTWYVWEQAKNNMGVELPLWYYVQTWYDKAAKDGYSVGKEPKPNSIMVWDYGEGFGGHVAYVTAVNGTTVTYTEGGSPMTEDGINNDSLTLDDMSTFLVGFIYLDNAPKPVVSKPDTPELVNPEPTPEPVTPKEPTKSTNNYLSNLFVGNLEFDFNKEILEYNFEVPYDTDKIEITAHTEDSKATLKGTGTFDLKVGENNFSVVVTSEDSNTKQYTININRQNKTEEKLTVKESQKQEIFKDNKKNIVKDETMDKKMMVVMAFLIASAVLIIVFIIYALINKSQNSKLRKNNSNK